MHFALFFFFFGHPFASKSRSFARSSAKHYRSDSFVVFLFVGHTPSERGAHRGAGGGAEGERPDHGREGGGAGPGGARAHPVGEAGTVGSPRGRGGVTALHGRETSFPQEPSLSLVPLSALTRHASLFIFSPQFFCLGETFGL